MTCLWCEAEASGAYLCSWHCVRKAAGFVAVGFVVLPLLVGGMVLCCVALFALQGVAGLRDGLRRARRSRA